MSTKRHLSTKRAAVSRTRKTHPRQTPQQIAKEAADAYFAGLATEIPSDNAPGEISLFEYTDKIQDAILEAHNLERSDVFDEHGWQIQSAKEAGWFLGLEIGKRLAAQR